MKRLIIIPLLFIGTFCFSQTKIDTLLGLKGKLIKDTALTIDGNYLFTPSRNHLSFDSTKLGWFLNGSKLYTDFAQVSIGSHTPRAKFMISDSTGAVGDNDSTGILLTNDTTDFSPSLTFNAKQFNSIAGIWEKAGFKIFSNTLTGNPTTAMLHIQKSINGGAYTDIFTINSNGFSTFANGIATSGSGSIIGTSVTTPQVYATNLILNGSSGVFGINETTSYGGGIGGGYNLAPVINGALSTAYPYKAFYFNPTLTNYPNIDLVGFQNEAGRNLFNSTTDNTGIGVTTIDHSAKFQVGGTSQGVMFPVMTQLQRDSLARPVTSVTVVNGGTNHGNSITTGVVTFSAGAIRAKGQFVTNSSGVITSITITEPGAYGAGQTPTVTIAGTGAFTPVLGPSAPATSLTIYCSDCTATDSSTGVYQTWNGSTWKNWW